MMTTNVFSRPWALMLLLAGAMAFASAGCFSLKIGDEPGDDDKKEKKESKVDKDDAVKIARRLARDEKINPRDYKVRDEKAEKGWWILFDHKSYGERVGFPYHFAVNVMFDGRAVLLKSR